MDKALAQRFISANEASSRATTMNAPRTKSGEFDRYWMDASDGFQPRTQLELDMLKAWSESAFNAGAMSTEAKDEIFTLRLENKRLREALQACVDGLESESHYYTERTGEAYAYDEEIAEARAALKGE